MLIKNLKRTFGFIHTHPLAKQSLFRSYLRFMVWQVQIMLSKKMIKKSFIGKLSFYAKKGLTGITGNIYTGLHEFNDMGFLLHFLRSTDTFFDVGANVGSYSLLASGYIGCNSFTFEPSPITYKYLCNNIQLNNLQDKIITHQIALGSESGKLSFTTSHDTGNHILLDEHAREETVTVDVKTIDDFKQHQPILLKIDVEGFETEVIKGGSDFFSQKTLNAIIIELNGCGGRYGYNEIDIHNYLLDIGFLSYLYHPLKRSFEQIKTYGSHNTIYIRNFDFVNDRCIAAPKMKILGVEF